MELGKELQQFKNIVQICFVINILSLIIFIAGGRSYGELYFGAVEVLGARSIIAAVLAATNIVMCVRFLKKRRLLVKELPFKCGRLVAVFGILAAVFTLITDMIFIPLVSIGWDWFQGNLPGILFVLPLFIALVSVITLVMIGLQLGFYLTSVIMYGLLFNKLRNAP
jgi:hypothetical protein